MLIFDCRITTRAAYDSLLSIVPKKILTKTMWGVSSQRWKCTIIAFLAKMRERVAFGHQHSKCQVLYGT